MCPRGGLMPRGCVCVKFALGGGVSVTPGGTQTHPGGPRANLGRRNPPQGVPPSPWGGVGVPPIHLGAGGGRLRSALGGGRHYPKWFSVTLGALKPPQGEKIHPKGGSPVHPGGSPIIEAGGGPYQVTLEAAEAVAVLEAEFAEVEDGQRRQLLGVGGEVPGFEAMPPQLDAFDVFHPRDDVIVAAIRNQAARHPRRRGGSVRRVLRVLGGLFGVNPSCETLCPA